jgi:hypothetical protein
VYKEHGDIDYLLMTSIHILVTSNEICKQCEENENMGFGQMVGLNKMHGTNFYFIEV